jgi:hypothetical protein
MVVSFFTNMDICFEQDDDEGDDGEDDDLCRLTIVEERCVGEEEESVTSHSF